MEKISKSFKKFLEKELGIYNSQVVSIIPTAIIKDNLSNKDYPFFFRNWNETHKFLDIYIKELIKNKILYYFMIIPFQAYLFDGFVLKNKIITKKGRILYRVESLGIEYVIFRNKNKAFFGLFYFYDETLANKTKDVGLFFNEMK